MRAWIFTNQLLLLWNKFPKMAFRYRSMRAFQCALNQYCNMVFPVFVTWIESGHPVPNMDLFLQIARLTGLWSHSAVDFPALITHAQLASSCQNIPILLPTSTVFSLCRSSIGVVGIAIVESRVTVMHKWSQRLTASKRNTRSELGKLGLQPRLIFPSCMLWYNV